MITLSNTFKKKQVPHILDLIQGWFNFLNKNIIFIFYQAAIVFNIMYLSINFHWKFYFPFALHDMVFSRREFLNHLISFCFIYADYTFTEQWKSITDFVKRIYLSYFKIKLEDQEKKWAPHIVWKLVLCTFVSEIIVIVNVLRLAYQWSIENKEITSNTMTSVW